MSWFILFCYIFFVYSMSVIITQSIGSDTFVVINKGKWE